jgi:Sulfotransferase family
VRLPNFLIVGAAKSGTTSLHYYLQQHPDIYLPAQKELHYFAREHMLRLAGGPGDRNVLSYVCCTKEEYESAYFKVAQQSAVGEISPSYLYFSDVSEGIKKELHDPKIIMILRNPIEKAFSQYMHLVRDNREMLDFYDALMAERERIERGWAAMWRYAESSLYTSRVQQYLDVFGDRNVRIFLYDDLVKSPKGLVRELLEFIGVESQRAIDFAKVHNRSGKPRSRFVSNLLTRPNPLRDMAKRILPADMTYMLKLRLQDLNTGAKGTIDGRSRAYLKAFCAHDVQALQQIVGRPIDWLD